MLQTLVRVADALVELQVGADTVQATPEHPFWANGGWTDAGNLVKGDELLRSDGLTMPVGQVRHRTAQVTTVYNVEVADWHTYLVSWWMFVVHNANKVCITGTAKKIAKAAKSKKNSLLALPTKVKSKRLQYLGRTPGKNSSTGKSVIERMTKEKKIVELSGEKKVLGPDGNWHDIDKTDMGHLDDAVSWWNREGRNYGAKSKEVRDWMKDAANYELEPSSINRSRGARLTETYLPPLK